MRLEEPRGARVAQPATPWVLWLQSASGGFVDLRIGRAARKSFAGTASLRAGGGGGGGGGRGGGGPDSCAPLLTWTRVIDSSGAGGTPDEARVEWSAVAADGTAIGDILREDSALPGDDYSEWWERVQLATPGVDARLRAADGAHAFFVEIGDLFGLAVGGECAAGCATIVGRDGAVTHSTHRSLEGVHVSEAASALLARERGWRLDRASSAGEPPAWLLRALDAREEKATRGA